MERNLMDWSRNSPEKPHGVGVVKGAYGRVRWGCDVVWSLSCGS